MHISTCLVVNVRVLDNPYACSNQQTSSVVPTLDLGKQNIRKLSIPSITADTITANRIPIVHPTTGTLTCPQSRPGPGPKYQLHANDGDVKLTL